MQKQDLSYLTKDIDFQSFIVPLPWSECPTLVDETNQTNLIEECEVNIISNV